MLSYCSWCASKHLPPNSSRNTGLRTCTWEHHSILIGWVQLQSEQWNHVYCDLLVGLYKCNGTLLVWSGHVRHTFSQNSGHSWKIHYVRNNIFFKSKVIFLLYSMAELYHILGVLRLLANKTFSMNGTYFTGTYLVKLFRFLNMYVNSWPNQT